MYIGAIARWYTYHWLPVSDLDEEEREEQGRPVELPRRSVSWCYIRPQALGQASALINSNVSTILAEGLA